MKLKLLSVIVAATAAASSTSNAVVIALGGVANTATSIGLITLDPDGAGANPRAAVSGYAIFVSVTSSLSGVDTSMNSLLASGTTTKSQFDTALSTLIGSTSATSPGIVRNATFTNGVLTSSGNVELGSISNKTYLFLVSEANSYITGIGAYTGANVPSTGAVTFNSANAGDTLGVGTSVLAAASGGLPISGFQLAYAVPEPSAALLGAVGALGLLRRRRN
jgi:hypothetical protein